MGLVLGIDESGTGAWAGPFYLVGVLVEDEDEFAKAVGGLRDSKKLSDLKRRELAPRIREHALKVYPFVATVESIREKGMRNTWREGVETIVTSASRLGPQIYIDGPRDKKVELPRNLSVVWEKKADDKYPSVMAASILAKTLRNDDMVALAKDFPKYGWAVNAGYGTADHRAAIELHGHTAHHRPIKEKAEVVVEVPEVDILDLFGSK